jgi:phosphate transport system substrate-binding protein
MLLCRFSFQNIIFPVKYFRCLPFALIFLLLVGCQILRPAPPDTAHPSDVYLENKGSDTLVNLALAWAEYYQDLHPEVRISVTGGGSGTGIAALLNGTVDIANSSRNITQVEIHTARARGIEPVEHVISQDAIAVIVHHDNPIATLTLQQISDVYSGVYNNWSELGGFDRPIVRLSRETNSGTHVYFLEEVMRLGDPENRTLFSQDTLLLPSAEGIMAEVRHNPNAIGYDGLGYITPDVKMIAVARDEQGPFVLPSAETVNDDSYPIARDLFMYTAGEPEGVAAEFLNFIFSEEAQQIGVELGFVPLVLP